MEKQNIWEQELSEGEKIAYEFTVGEKYRKYGFISWSIISVFLLLAFGLGILTFLIGLFYFKFYVTTANKYAFTDRRILIRRGWLTVNTISVDYDRITDIRVVQNMMDKAVYATGTLAINTAGSSNTEIILKYIQDPYEVKKQLNKIRDQYRAK